MACYQKEAISLIGFNSAEQSMLELFFNRPQQIWFTLVHPRDASYLFVDFSSDLGEREYLKQLRNYPELESISGIALVNKGDVRPTFLTLNRPLTLASLTQILETLSRQINQQVDDLSYTTSDRQKVFEQWQARKQATVDAMLKWKQYKQLDDNGKQPFSIGRYSAHNLSPNTYLDRARHRQEAFPREDVVPRVDLNEELPALTTKSCKENQYKQQIYECSDDIFEYLPEQNLNDPAGLRRVKFNLEHCLLPWVEQAVKLGRQSQKAYQIVGLPRELIYIPSTDSFYCDLDEDLLMYMARAKFSFCELSLAMIEPSEELIHETARYIIADKLVWKLALLTSRGRISDALDLEKPLQLIRKPDFNYFDVIPHAGTLSELWYRNRYSPMQILTKTALSQRYVFTFLVAADAVGLFKP